MSTGAALIEGWPSESHRRGPMNGRRTGIRLVRCISALTAASISLLQFGGAPSANAATTLASGRAGYLYGAAAITTTDAWAVGTAGNHTTLALHWDGTG